MNCLTLELFDALVVLARNKRKWDNTRHVHLGAENMAVQVELLEHGLDVLETFLVVGTCTTHPDLDLVLVEKRCHFTECADDTLECAGDLCRS